MAETFTIAHISDLHMDPGMALGSKHSHCVERLVAMATLLNSRELDLLIVTGDLTDRGDRDSLLNADRYLFEDAKVADKERTGLRLPREKVLVVPGNHDAYGCEEYTKGGYLDCWQKSLKVFNEIFTEWGKEAIHGCRYRWLEKNGRGIYIALADSCYMGDPEIENTPDIAKLVVSKISRVARGWIGCNQSEQLLTWCDRGMRGILPDPGKPGSNIPKERYAQSLKLLAMHHYLFEPQFETPKKKTKGDFFLKLFHRDVVFRNFAMADFDMFLCGHKHKSDFNRLKYGTHFDKRARARYLLNLFRRLIGIYTIPLQFEALRGRKYPRDLREPLI